MQIAKATLVVTTLSLGILIAASLGIYNKLKQDKEIKGVPIQTDSCIDYVQDFLSKRKLYTYANRLAIGGQLDSVFLRNWTAVAPTNQYDVLNIFPCRIPITTGGTDKFFVAYSTAVLEDSMKCGCVMPPMLKVSAGEFIYQPNNTSFDDVKYFLKEQPIPIETNFPSDMPRNEVTNYVNDFLSTYTNDAGDHYNKSFCTAFTKHDIDTILGQKDPGIPGFKIRGIRYLLGYDSKGHSNDNRIRIILIGYDQNGNNYIENRFQKPAVMIERAWPPDGCQ